MMERIETPPAPTPGTSPGERGIPSASPSADDPDGPLAPPPSSTGRREHGEPLTFEQLYEREYRTMVRVAFLLVGSTESAEEIVQDAFVRTHLRWARIREPGGFLRTCVVNGCRDRLRRRVRLAARLPLLLDEPLKDRDGRTGTDDALDLHRLLLRLPLRQRTAIVGRFYCGWDDETIATALDARPATVRSLVSRGLAALRTEFPT